MYLKRAFMVLLAALWVLSQAAGINAHSNTADLEAEFGVASKASLIDNRDTDCLANAVPLHSGKQDQSHHGDTSGEACCGATCSFANDTIVFSLAEDGRPQPFDRDNTAPPTIADLGLPTPPPDTTV